MNDKFTLGKAKKGDVFKFNPNGKRWMVSSKGVMIGVGGVIHIISTAGARRRYTELDRMWNRSVTYV